METYTDLRVSYLIQNFCKQNKYKNYEVIVELPPTFKVSERTFYILWNEWKFDVLLQLKQWCLPS